MLVFGAKDFSGMRRACWLKTRLRLKLLQFTVRSFYFRKLYAPANPWWASEHHIYTYELTRECEDADAIFVIPMRFPHWLDK